MNEATKKEFFGDTTLTAVQDKQNKTICSSKPKESRAQEKRNIYVKKVYFFINSRFFFVNIPFVNTQRDDGGCRRNRAKENKSLMRLADSRREIATKMRT